jgi:protein CpxP
MKLRLIPVLAGAIALTLAAAPLATQVVQAQSNTGTPSQSGPRMKAMKGMKALNLSADQKAQMQQIHQETQAQIEQVLTAEQRQQLEAAKAQRQATRAERQAARTQGQRQARPQGATRERKGPFADLNLSADQKTRIQAIRQAARQRMEAVLTPEQRQQLNEMKQARQQRQQGQQQ